MTRLQVHVRLVCSSIAFSLSLACGSQTSVVAATPLGTQNLPATFPDVPREQAVRLDGRLFFSALERQRMDAARKRGVVIGDVGKFAEAPPSVLNGFVKRNDGQITIWVDGEPRNHPRSLKIRDLVPQDVGGNTDAIKVLDSHASANLSRSPVKIKRTKSQDSRNAATKPVTRK